MLRTAASILALALATPALAQTAPTAAQADAFVADAEKQLEAISIPINQQNWINATYITDDTDALAARANAQATELED